MIEPNLETPVDTDEFSQLLDDAYEYLNEQQEICQSRYKLSKYERWDYDQESGLLTFSDDGVVKLKIEYEDVGSVSLSTNTWLWGWANPYLEDKIKSEIVKVRDYGKQHNFEKLTKRKWTAEEIDGWEMTAVSAYIMKAKGAYRVPSDNLYSFFLFKKITDLRE